MAGERLDAWLDFLDPGLDKLIQIGRAQVGFDLIEEADWFFSAAKKPAELPGGIQVA